MRVISAVVGRQYSERVGRIAYRLIEVDHSVVSAARPDPCIHCLAFDFFCRSIETWGDSRVLERYQSTAEHYDPPLVSTRNELQVAGDDIVCSDLFRRWRYNAGLCNVVDASKHQIRQRGHWEVHGIADYQSSCRNGKEGPPTECERSVGVLDDARIFLAERHMSSPDHQRFRAEGVGDSDPDLTPADAGMHDLPQGLICILCRPR
jgi:hypothetical protein